MELTVSFFYLISIFFNIYLKLKGPQQNYAVGRRDLYGLEKLRAFAALVFANYLLASTNTSILSINKYFCGSSTCLSNNLPKYSIFYKVHHRHSHNLQIKSEN